MGRNIVRFHVVFPVRIRVMIWVVFWASSPNILYNAAGMFHDHSCIENVVV